MSRHTHPCHFCPLTVECDAPLDDEGYCVTLGPDTTYTCEACDRSEDIALLEAEEAVDADLTSLEYAIAYDRWVSMFANGPGGPTH